MKNHTFKCALSYVVITLVYLVLAQAVNATSYSISDSGGHRYFNHSGQLINTGGGLINWSDTPYSKSNLLNLLNTYFAPDYEFGSSWDFATLRDVNNSGQAVGDVNYSSVNYGLLLDGSKISVFGAWSIALSINNNGQIVGDDNDSIFVTNAALLPDIHDFIPASGSIYFSSLNSTIPMEELLIQNNDWVHLGPALDNNDLGQIVGIGTGGVTGTYLLTPIDAPVPEPSTFLLLGAGLVGICIRNGRTRSQSKS